MDFQSSQPSPDRSHFGSGASTSSNPLSSSSGTATPTSASAGSSSSFLTGSLYNAFGGLMRRLSSDPAGQLQPPGHGTRSLDATSFPQLHPSVRSHPQKRLHQNDGVDGVFSPPFPRTASPLRPLPLEPLALTGFHEDTPESARLLTPGIAEEIRIMVPERLRIEEEWKLIYSLEQDGASLATLYEKCAAYAELRSGFVLVVQDRDGGTFGAYLSEYPHPSSHYFGTGECFLWRASFLPSLPPLPSTDTTHLSARTTTISAFPPSQPHYPITGGTASHRGDSDAEPLIPGLDGLPTSSAASSTSADRCSSSLASVSSSFTSSSFVSSAVAPQPPPSPSIRFSAFPYSGVNEYFMYCEPHSLSVGGGDSKYGLFLDDNLERGISSTCLTFGNQPLSDEGDRFGVLGVEVWAVGSRRP